MAATLIDARPVSGDGFRHEALLYSTESEFLDGTLPFLRGALAAGEPALAVLSAGKIALLRTALGRAADRVRFADMAEVGRNPARIIPAWQRFVDENATEGRRPRGIGEPIWAARTPAELVECQGHESLLNVAFADGPAWDLLCPYDTTSLDRAVIEEAHRSHSHVHHGGVSAPGSGAPSVWSLHEPLPEPTRHLGEMTIGPASLAVVRALAATVAHRFGLDADRADDLVLAVNEIATNSLVHGGGSGSFRMWRDGRSLVCEVRDQGRIEDPLAGRREPAGGVLGGRGLWMANQLCDLVQIRSRPSGSVVRLHMSLSQS